MKLPSKFEFDRTYYLAGPMSGYAEHNYPAFDRAQTELRGTGVAVESPHTIPWPTESAEGEELWKAMMREALRMLLSCQGIILLGGWTESKGAMLEYSVAAGLKMPVYFLDGKYVIPMHYLKETN